MVYTLLIKDGREYLIDGDGDMIAQGRGRDGKLDAEDVMFALGITFDIEEIDEDEDFPIDKRQIM